MKNLILLLFVIAMLSATAEDEKPLVARVAERDYPSVFQAWNPADTVPGESAFDTLVRHDLIFNGAYFFGLEWNNAHEGLATGFTSESIVRAKEKRAKLLAANPNLVLLLEIRYRDAHKRFLPEDHPFWKRDEAGDIVFGWEEGGYLQLDFSNPEYRARVAEQAAAAVATGVVDGVMVDWWRDDADRLALVQAIRAGIGEDALILANANDRRTPFTAPYINGYFMECYRSDTPVDWKRIAETLAWAEANLRRPRINCLETWYHDSRQDLGLMRATTTLVLTLSDGYCLFSDPNDLPTGDHLHDWYPFWDLPLGKPKGPGKQRRDGASQREYSGGTVIYNPMGNRPVSMEFDTPRRSVATGRTAHSHTVPTADGDVFLPSAQE